MNDKYELCAAQHFGYWMAKPSWLAAMIASYNAGTLPKAVVDQDDQPLYRVDETGVAYIGVQGQLTKGRSSYGGTSSVATRQALRAAKADGDVKGIMLDVDSPGGTVDGQLALGDAVYRVRAAGNKPIHVHADGGMHSAALWTGSQAGFVSASAMTEIGSIGTVASVRDYSEAFENEGVKVHVISTGEMKGAFTPGTEVTDEMLSDLQARVDEMNQFFLNAVKRGRGMSIADVRALADGRDWLAADAMGKGLIDAVMDRDEAVNTLRKEIRHAERDRKSASRARMRRAEIAGL